MAQQIIRREALPAALRGTTITVTIGAAHAESAAINAELIRVVATVACHVEFGSAPVATSESMFLPADAPEYFRFTAGDRGLRARSLGRGNAVHHLLKSRKEKS